MSHITSWGFPLALYQLNNPVRTTWHGITRISFPFCSLVCRSIASAAFIFSCALKRRVNLPPAFDHRDYSSIVSRSREWRSSKYALWSETNSVTDETSSWKLVRCTPLTCKPVVVTRSWNACSSYLHTVSSIYLSREKIWPALFIFKHLARASHIGLVQHCHTMMKHFRIQLHHACTAVTQLLACIADAAPMLCHARASMPRNRPYSR